MRWLGGATEVREIVAAKAPPPAVESLLLTALALAWPGSAPPYPDHTLVDQAVAAARLRTPAAAGVRQRRAAPLRARARCARGAARHQPVGAFNHPLWWIERIRHDWPAQWQALLATNNEHPPMTLRVNARRGTGAAYVHRLARSGGPQASSTTRRSAARRSSSPSRARWRSCPASPKARSRCRTPSPSAPPACSSAAGCRRTRACSTPARRRAARRRTARTGGARRRRARRRPGAAGARAGEPEPADLKAELKADDARETARWWDGRPFDAILLDAPCSASGIVRRHPDVRWLRRPDDVTALARLQAEILEALWPLLAPGGRLLYATCSVFRSEGSERIDAFLQRRGAAAARLDPRSPGHLLPLPDNAAGGRRPRQGVAATASTTPSSTRPDAPTIRAMPVPPVRRRLLQGLGLLLALRLDRCAGPRAPGHRARRARGASAARARSRSSSRCGSRCRGRSRTRSRTACRCTSSPRPSSSAAAGTGATSASPASRAAGASPTSR